MHFRASEALSVTASLSGKNPTPLGSLFCANVVQHVMVLALAPGSAVQFITTCLVSPFASRVIATT
jgi:hypothetical protein